jgi:hypothetical protein
LSSTSVAKVVSYYDNIALYVILCYNVNMAIEASPPYPSPSSDFDKEAKGLFAQLSAQFDDAVIKPEEYAMNLFIQPQPSNPMFTDSKHMYGHLLDPAETWQASVRYISHLGGLGITQLTMPTQEGLHYVLRRLKNKNGDYAQIMSDGSYEELLQSGPETITYEPVDLHEVLETEGIDFASSSMMSIHGLRLRIAQLRMNSAGWQSSEVARVAIRPGEQLITERQMQAYNDSRIHRPLQPMPGKYGYEVVGHHLIAIHEVVNDDNSRSQQIIAFHADGPLEHTPEVIQRELVPIHTRMPGFVEDTQYKVTQYTSAPASLEQVRNFAQTVFEAQDPTIGYRK